MKTILATLNFRLSAAIDVISLVSNRPDSFTIKFMYVMWAPTVTIPGAAPGPFPKGFKGSFFDYPGAGPAKSLVPGGKDFHTEYISSQLTIPASKGMINFPKFWTPKYPYIFPKDINRPVLWTPTYFKPLDLATPLGQKQNLNINGPGGTDAMVCDTVSVSLWHNSSLGPIAGGYHAWNAKSPLLSVLQNSAQAVVSDSVSGQYLKMNDKFYMGDGMEVTGASSVDVTALYAGLDKMAELAWITPDQKHYVWGFDFGSVSPSTYMKAVRICARNLNAPNSGLTVPKNITVSVIASKVI